MFPYKHVKQHNHLNPTRKNSSGLN
uniref:Uncharacterized protein n=1 Tax=Anguilla anguilla TaxID=7936 RepID=A0A0E9TWP4_ANGAN